MTNRPAFITWTARLHAAVTAIAAEPAPAFAPSIKERAQEFLDHARPGMKLEPWRQEIVDQFRSRLGGAHPTPASYREFHDAWGEAFDAAKAAQAAQDCDAAWQAELARRAAEPQPLPHPHLDGIEARIADRLLRDVLEDGCKVSVHDGEQLALRRSNDRAAIWSAMASTGEDHLIVRRSDGGQIGTIRLVYGNGADLICDSTVNAELSALLAGAEALAEELGA